MPDVLPFLTSITNEVVLNGSATLHVFSIVPLALASKIPLIWSLLVGVMARVGQKIHFFTKCNANATRKI